MKAVLRGEYIATSTQQNKTKVSVHQPDFKPLEGQSDPKTSQGKEIIQIRDKCK